MVKAILFPIVAGVICFVLAGLLRMRVGSALDLYIFGIYFVISAKFFLIAGVALVGSALVILLAH